LGLLDGSLAYCPRPIDAAADYGAGWSAQINPILKSFGVRVLDPTNKPKLYGYNAEETANSVEQRRQWKEAGEYDKVVALSEIRSIDLRLCDLAWFGCVYLDMKQEPCGTIEEIVTLVRQKKPVIIYSPSGKSKVKDWVFWMMHGHETIFDNMVDLAAYLTKVDVGEIKDKRWRLFQGLNQD
jgi:hypothetical protein